VDPEEPTRDGKTPVEILKGNAVSKDLLQRAIGRKKEAAAKKEL
jgi:hypothetical protein